MSKHPCCAGVLLAVDTFFLQPMQCPFGEGWGWAGALWLLFHRGREKLNVVGKRLQESRALVEGLMANLGEDGEGKPAALKHGDAARAALWRQPQRWQKCPSQWRAE